MPAIIYPTGRFIVIQHEPHPTPDGAAFEAYSAPLSRAEADAHAQHLAQHHKKRAFITRIEDVVEPVAEGP